MKDLFLTFALAALTCALAALSGCSSSSMPPRERLYDVWEVDARDTLAQDQSVQKLQSGQYQSLTKNSGGLTLPTCHDCPAGSDAPAGSTAITDCKCNRGYTGQNGEVCTACPAGKFKAVTAQPTDPCTDCAQGKYQPDQGKLFCFVCPPGTTSLSRATSAADCVAR